VLLLVLVSLLWAFSFGLTKGLTAGLDGTFVATARLGLALLVFSPFLRLRGLAPRTAFALTGIGAVQFGFMYLAYNASFHYLPAYQVALFTITTPILVTLLADALDRTLQWRALGAALLAVFGTGLVVFQAGAPVGTFTGFALVQCANLTFAIGQVAYQRLRARHPTLRDRDIFGLLYAGAFAVALIALGLRGDISVTHHQVTSHAGLSRRDRFRAGLLPLEQGRHARQRRHPRRDEQRQGPFGSRLLIDLL